MDETLRRVAPLTGIGAVALFVIASIVAMVDSPDFAGSAQEIATYYVEEKNSVLTGATLIAISAPLFAWFFGSLRAGIARAEGGPGRLASTAFGAGIGTLTLIVGGWMITAMGALRADEDGQIGLEAATVFFDISNILIGAGAPALMAATLLATAIASLRYKALLPSWLAVITIVVAIVDVIPPISFAGLALSMLWILIVSVLLYVQRVTVEPTVRA